jgi:arginyl-tRNA synthetase
MNIINVISSSFAKHLITLFHLEESKAHQAGHLVINTDETKQDFGDLNANTAMVLAKELKKSPRDVATQIIESFKHPYVDRIEIAGPGFLNFFLTPQAFAELAHALATHKEAFFKLEPGTHTENYNIEFVSANPTGPVHLGHGRGGIIGDVLGNILLFLGHRVTKEFYINDAGVQIQKLGASLKARCQQVAGIDAQVPEDGYQGEYLVDLARECINEHSDMVLKESDAFFQEYAKEKLLHAIKKVLHEYGINFDVWFSEKSLHTDGSIERTLQILQKHG